MILVNSIYQLAAWYNPSDPSEIESNVNYRTSGIVLCAVFGVINLMIYVFIYFQLKKHDNRIC